MTFVDSGGGRAGGADVAVTGTAIGEAAREVHFDPGDVAPLPSVLATWAISAVP